jgi:hypothetical protein
VIATLRALGQLHQVDLRPAALAAFALAVETEDLGIAAGPQDRVAQAYGGVTYMEFAAPPRYESLPGRLPPLLIAWRATAAGGACGNWPGRLGRPETHCWPGTCRGSAGRWTQASRRGERCSRWTRGTSR